MPYTTEKMRLEALENGLEEFTAYLYTLPIELRKGFLAHAVMYLGKYTFDYNYFGLSTGCDAVRSALVELKRELQEYEDKAKERNGNV